MKQVSLALFLSLFALAGLVQQQLVLWNNVVHTAILLLLLLEGGGGVPNQQRCLSSPWLLPSWTTTARPSGTWGVKVVHAFVMVTNVVVRPKHNNRQHGRHIHQFIHSSYRRKRTQQEGRESDCRGRCDPSTMTTMTSSFYGRCCGGGAGWFLSCSRSGPDDNDFFETPSQPVFIEDTDAYGVMYNSNYLRAYDRALQTYYYNDQQQPKRPDEYYRQTYYYNDQQQPKRPDEYYLCQNVISADNKKHTDNNPDQQKQNQRGGWFMIVAFQEQKFVSAPRLGSEYIVKATRCRFPPEINTNKEEEYHHIWDMDMISSMDHNLVYNTIRGVQVQLGPTSSHSSPLPLPPPPQQQQQQPPPLLARLYSIPSCTFITYRDEYESHPCWWYNHYDKNDYYFLPLYQIMNYYERVRTMGLGGPHMLERLQNNHGILFVVTRVDGCCFLAPTTTTTTNTTTIAGLRPGIAITIETQFEIKHRGRVIVCYQTAKLAGHKEEDNDDICLARACVTILAIDAATKRPASQLPEWLLESITLLSQQSSPRGTA